MNRADKLKTLQEVLQGRTESLRELHNQHRKQTAPYRDVHGILDTRQCPASLANLTIADTESIVDGMPIYEPLGEWLHKAQEPGARSDYWFRKGMTLIDIADRQYDEVSLNYIVVQSQQYGLCYSPGGTVGRLRHLYQQSASCVDAPFFAVCLETDLSRYHR